MLKFIENYLHFYVRLHFFNNIIICTWLSTSYTISTVFEIREHHVPLTFEKVSQRDRWNNFIFFYRLMAKHISENIIARVVLINVRVHGYRSRVHKVFCDMIQKYWKDVNYNYISYKYIIRPRDCVSSYLHVQFKPSFPYCFYVHYVNIYILCTKAYRTKERKVHSRYTITYPIRL